MAMLIRFAFLCFVLAAAAASHLRKASVRRHSDDPTEARTIPAKYVFFAGIEGSGHHFFNAVMQLCFDFGRCGKRSDRFLKHANAASLEHNPTLMRTVWIEEDFSPRRDVVYPLNPLVASNFMSYPTTKKILDPHIEDYIEAANYFGDSLKVVVLLRNPQSIMHSVTRRFNHSEARLVESLQALSTQLRVMPRETYMCVRFEELDHIGHAFRDFMDVPRFDIEEVMSWVYSEEPGCEGNNSCPSADSLVVADRNFREEFCSTAVAAEPRTNVTGAHFQVVRWLMG